MKKKQAKPGAKIYKVQFNDHEGDHYFGSLSAIYTVFTPEQIGCVVSTLWGHKIAENKPYLGKKCTISLYLMTRKRTNRGKL